MMEIKVLTTKIALANGSNLIISDGNYDFLEEDGRKLFLTHFPNLAIPMAKSGEYDAVFYGHDHDKKIDRIGNCLVLNPGELSTHKTGIASYAIYDTQTNEAEIIELKNPFITKL